MIQAKVIRIKLNNPLRRHDSAVLHHSGMIPMSSWLTDSEEGNNAKVGADNSYPLVDHVSPVHAETD